VKDEDICELGFAICDGGPDFKSKIAIRKSKIANGGGGAEVRGGMVMSAKRLHVWSRREVLRAGGILGATMAVGWGARRVEAADKVRMACWSQAISEQANIFAAQEFGWFKEQGLEYEFVPGAGGGEALKHVLVGNADFAFTNVEPILFGVEQGAQVQAVYNIYPKNVFNVVSLKGRNIIKPQDLTGKRIGVTAWRAARVTISSSSCTRWG